ncbi:MAG TPA: hypothetical protein VNP89_03215 [Gaiellaceae bacterium]|nr:hypothetical protein [Gaiellaceae bacterium]
MTRATPREALSAFAGASLAIATPPNAETVPVARSTFRTLILIGIRMVELRGCLGDTG